MTLNTEAPFGFEELFFSRTNTKGIILSGNSVFRRVSGYEWSELLNRPHSLVRHPDMPRGVFYLFWKTILNGSPIGAYVKNRSKDGSYYWVFALAVPLDDGFLSVRLKPSSAIFDIVKAEYAKLLAIEEKAKMPPSESCAALEKVIQSLGFKDYEAFMTHALMEELASRQAQLGLPPSELLKKLQEVLRLAKGLLENWSGISQTFRASTLLPLNLTIQATKLVSGGDQLAVIASKYADLTKEIQGEFERFEDLITLVQNAVSSCQYLICNGILQSEVIQFFAEEKDTGPIDAAIEMSLLESLNAAGSKESISALTTVLLEFDKLISACERLKTVTTGLEIVRLMGKIEIARIDGHRDHLNQLIGDLLKFKSFLVTALQDVASTSVTMKSITREIVLELR